MSSQKTDYTLFFDSSVPQSAVSSISLHLSFFHILFIFHLTGKKHVSSVYKSHVSFCCCVSFHINTSVIASLVLCSEYTLQHYMYHKTHFFSASLINCYSSHVRQRMLTFVQNVENPSVLISYKDSCPRHGKAVSERHQEAVRPLWRKYLNLENPVFFNSGMGRQMPRTR